MVEEEGDPALDMEHLEDDFYFGDKRSLEHSFALQFNYRGRHDVTQAALVTTTLTLRLALASQAISGTYSA